MTEISLFPIYSVILRTCSSKKLASGVVFVTTKDKEVRMETSLLPFSRLSITSPSVLRSCLETREPLKLSQLLSDIVWGNIIDPI